MDNSIRPTCVYILESISVLCISLFYYYSDSHDSLLCSTYSQTNTSSEESFEPFIKW